MERDQLSQEVGQEVVTELSMKLQVLFQPGTDIYSCHNIHSNDPSRPNTTSSFLSGQEKPDSLANP